MLMVVGCLMLLLLDQDDFLLLLHPLHGGGLLHLQDGHLVHVWPGKSALPSTAPLGPIGMTFRHPLGRLQVGHLPGFLVSYFLVLNIIVATSSVKMSPCVVSREFG